VKRIEPRRAGLRAGAARSTRIGGAFVLAAATGLLGATSASAKTSTLPFSDPQAVGYIGICDLAGHNVTSGSLDSTPFAWKVVSSVRPPKQFSRVGENADLDIYQAQRELAPGDWTGENLMAASDYAHPSRPTAEGTYRDVSLRTITLQIPPKWDGMYALRMQFGKTGYGIYNATYPMTVIQVTGNRWHVISGGLVNCAKAKGVSQEQLTGVVKAQTPPKPMKNETAPIAPVSDRPSAASVPSAAPTPSGSSAPSTNGLTRTVSDPISAPLTLAHSGGGGLSPALVALIVVVALIVLVLGWLLLSRRHRAPPVPQT
jgi:hypothetical protein